MDPSSGPAPLSRMERENESSAFGLRVFAGWLTLIIVAPLFYILVGVARDAQTPIIAAILWARAKELAGFPVSEAVVRHVVLEAARGVRKREESKAKYFADEAARLAVVAAQAVDRVGEAKQVADGGGGDGGSGVRRQPAQQRSAPFTGAGATAPALFKDE